MYSEKKVTLSGGKNVVNALVSGWQKVEETFRIGTEFQVKLYVIATKNET